MVDVGDHAGPRAHTDSEKSATLEPPAQGGEHSCESPCASDKIPVVDDLPRERAADERPTDTDYRPDSSQEAAAWSNGATGTEEMAELVVRPIGKKPTLRMAYFFAGKSRKGSVGEELRGRCGKNGCGLIVHEVDILNGGKAHDLIKEEPGGMGGARSRLRIRRDLCHSTVLHMVPSTLFREAGSPPLP